MEFVLVYSTLLSEYYKIQHQMLRSSVNNVGMKGHSCGITEVHPSICLERLGKTMKNLSQNILCPEEVLK
jgi:hypothetical protein